MFVRRVLLLTAIAAMCALLVAESTFAQPPKKKLRPAKDKDGVNNVVGAWWEVNATNDLLNKKITFRFRAKDGVLYNKVGQEVGSLVPVKNIESRVTWREPLPLQGTFKITMAKVGRWNGILETEGGQKWTCLLKAIDR